jgi:DNA polymerase sigma
VLNPILKSVGLVLLGVAAKLEATRNLPHHFLLLIAKIKAFNLAILSFGSRRLHSECSSSSCLSQAFALDYFSERLIFTFLEFQPSILQFFGASIILLETQNIVSSSLTNVSLEVFGSFASGFAHSESDLDLTLNYSYYMTLDKSQSIEILKCVDPALYSLNLLQSSIYTARIPVLKLREPISGVPADLSASNPISVLSHRLLALYSEMDERVRVLIFVIRKWSKVQGIGDPLHGGLGTFAFTLLVIHFLQNTRPIILPVLKLPDFRQAVDVESSFLNISNQVHAFSQDSTRKCNLQSLKTLIVQLFSYYSSFDFSRGVISIRNCKLAKISGRNQLLSISSRFVPRQIHYIAIEDPCNYSHNVASAVNEEMTKLIQMCFVRGYRIVSKEDANINDLFSVPSRHPSNTPDRSKMIGWKRIRQQA